MAASYPSATKSFSIKASGQTIAASHIDELQDEVIALESDLRAGVPATRGGTGLTVVTSGGVLYGASGTTIASSAALAANDVVLGGGAGAAPTTLGAQAANKFLSGPVSGSAAVVTARLIDPLDLESTVVTLATQFDKTNATLADITGFTFTLVAGKTYHFRAVLHVLGDGTGGSKIAMGGTCTATTIIASGYGLANAGGVTYGRATALASQILANLLTTQMFIIEGTIIVNAGGTLTVQFAQNSASGTSSVLVGSSFQVY